MKETMIKCPNGHMFSKRQGKVCPYCKITVEEDESIGGVPRNADDIEAKLLFESIDPVCGWLAVIEGNLTGKSYTLHSGKNFIGRADDMDIRLPGDSAIARRNHAVVVYEPKNRKFMLLPGEAEGIVYLGNDAIYQATPLPDMSVIGIGRTKLLFRPLCGENFAWNEE